MTSRAESSVFSSYGDGDVMIVDGDVEYLMVAETSADAAVDAGELDFQTTQRYLVSTSRVYLNCSFAGVLTGGKTGRLC